jgi:hypothetical protein
MDLEQEHDSHDKIELFMYGQITCAMSALWHFYGYQDYPASSLALLSFKVRTQEQLKHIDILGQMSDLIVCYNRPPKLSHLKFINFLKTYNHSSKLSIYYQNTMENCRSKMKNYRQLRKKSKSNGLLWHQK